MEPSGVRGLLKAKTLLYLPNNGHYSYHIS